VGKKMDIDSLLSNGQVNAEYNNLLSNAQWARKWASKWIFTCAKFTFVFELLSVIVSKPHIFTTTIVSVLHTEAVFACMVACLNQF
jgi:hypothetical protein